MQFSSISVESPVYFKFLISICVSNEFGAILLTLKPIKRRKANWIGYILRRNCLLKHVIEGKRRER
jgi:hypothetical protein